MISPTASRTVLLTLGRLPVSLELARALSSAGWRVVVADPFAWHLCRISNSVSKSFKVTAPTVDSEVYLAELAQVVRSEDVSLVLPVSEETLFVTQLKERLDENVHFFCIGQDALLTLHDKYLFSQFAVSLGLPVPQTALTNDMEACGALINQPYIVKPRLSCAGAGVRFGAAGDSLLRHEKSGGNIVQQQMQGASCSTFAIAIHGQTTVHVCYRSLMESGAVSVLFEEIPMPASITRFIDQVVQTLNYTGMISFDFIQDGDGVWRAIECNPRATSGMHFLQSQEIMQGLCDADASRERRLAGRRQEFWSCLAQVEGRLFKGQIDRRGWRNLFKTRDITWRRDDAKPFLLMCFVLAPQLLKSIRSGMPISQILMSDVGWRKDVSSNDKAVLHKDLGTHEDAGTHGQ